MNLRCTFHVSPASFRAPRVVEKPPMRPRMPSLLDLDIEWVEDQQPRGTKSETWSRARGWSSED